MLKTLMGSGRFATFDEGRQDTPQVAFVEDQNVVETLFAHGAHPPFGKVAVTNICPLATNQLAMPTQYGFRLKEADQITFCDAGRRELLLQPGRQSRI